MTSFLIFLRRRWRAGWPFAAVSTGLYSTFAARLWRDQDEIRAVAALLLGQQGSAAS
jgi:hypothetical protein